MDQIMTVLVLVVALAGGCGREVELPGPQCEERDVVRVVLDEDFTIGEGIQQDLATGANQPFTFGRYECGLHLGQHSIDAALAGELRL